MDRRAARSYEFWITVAIIGLPFLLVAHQPDLGSAMLIGLTGAAVMFAAGLSWRIILPLVIAAAVLVPPYVMFGMHDYQRHRVLTFLNPEADMADEEQTEGDWTHLNPADWINNPHPPDPQENTEP